jgi:hypothetical protein
MAQDAGCEVKRGRPRRFGEVVRVRVTNEVHDALCREALRRDVPVAKVIRERLAVVTKPSSAPSSAQ